MAEKKGSCKKRTHGGSALPEEMLPSPLSEKKWRARGEGRKKNPPTEKKMIGRAEKGKSAAPGTSKEERGPTLGKPNIKRGRGRLFIQAVKEALFWETGFPGCKRKTRGGNT